MEAFERACRDEGLRVTHQRLEIYLELATAVDHPSAEVLHKRLRLRIPTLSLDTVYRTLATFARHGLINRVETVENQSRYEATGVRHHHLICSRCQEIIDFQWPAMDETALPEEIARWGCIESRNVVYGICSKCLE